VPESEGETAEGEVNMVEVQQDPNQSSEDLASDFASEGKPESITYFCLLLQYFMRCLCIYVQELNWNLRCMILGSEVQILACQVASCHA
jgi:hypothetical protein